MTGKTCTALLLLLCGCSSLSVRDNRAIQGRALFGSKPQGKGLYLLNIKAGDEGAPNVNLPPLTNSVFISVLIANGYDHEVLLRKQDVETFGIYRVEAYDRNGVPLGWYGHGDTVDALWPGFHFEYENLDGGFWVQSNEVVFCGCKTTRFAKRYDVTYELFDGDRPYGLKNGAIMLPEGAYRVDITARLALEYMVVGSKAWRTATLPIVYRSFRPDAANQLKIILYKPKDAGQGGIVVQGLATDREMLKDILKQRSKDKIPLELGVFSTKDASQALIGEVMELGEDAGITNITRGEL